MHRFRAHRWPVARFKRARRVALLLFALELPAAEPGEHAPNANWVYDALPLHPAGVGEPLEARGAWHYASRWPSIQRQVRDARRFLQEPTPVLDDRVVNEGRSSGDRQIYEVPMRLRLSRLIAFVFAEGVENEGEFLPAIEKEMAAILSEPAWRLGGMLTSETGTSKRTDIDLSTAPRAWALATADYWLGARLSPELRRNLREQLNERVFGPYLADAEAEKKRFFWFEREVNNWGPVCHAGVVGAALAIIESREQRARFVQAALPCLDGYLNGWSMSPDGLCIEGVGYWDYGFGTYLLLAETLWRSSGGRINLYAGPRVRQLATATRGLELSHGTYPAFSDCAVYMRPNSAILWLIKQRFGTNGPKWPETPDGGSAVFRPSWAFQELTGRPDPRDLAGNMFALHPLGDRLAAYGIFAFPLSAGIANRTEPVEADPLRAIFIDSGLAVLRTSVPGKPVLSLAVKGGHNGEPHGHHDQGSYVVAVDGWPLLLDPGAELYTPATFDQRRYDSMMNNSFGHPVPIVGGKAQRHGKLAKSRMRYTRDGDDKEEIEMDLTACYDVPELNKLTRTFSFFRRESRIEIVDEVEFSRAQSFGTAFVTNSAWEQRPTGLVVSDGGFTLNVAVQCATGPLDVRSDVVTAHRQKPGIAPIRVGYHLREAALASRIVTVITVSER